jgi:AcrR family transcriptional regulator
MRLRDEIKEKAIRHRAMELIVNEGFDGLSMHKLAKAADISVATIYIYYKDREDLILSLCKEGLERMTQVTLKNFDPHMPFSEGLKIQWQNRAEFWLKNPIEAQFMERMRHSPYHEKFMGYISKEFTNAMQTFVVHAIERKELVRLPIEVFWCVAYAPLYQLVKFHLDGSKFLGGKKVQLTEQVMDQTLQLVLKALKP